jgi:hypothetical protein
MYIEDLIVELTRFQLANVWDEKLVYSFRQQLDHSNYLTEKQRHLAIVLLKKYSKSLQPIHTQLDSFLKNPIFKYPVRTINNDTYASIATYGKWGASIKVEFPYDQNLVEEIRKSRDFFDLATFDKEQKAWFFSLNESSICKLVEIFKNLTCDDQLTEYLNDVRHIKDNIGDYVPILTLENGIPVLKNSSTHLPPLVSTEIVPAIFECLKNGITVWDDEINSYLLNESVDLLTRYFLTKHTDSGFYIDCEKNSITDLADLDTIVKHLSPCLVVIPLNHELEILQMFDKFLKEKNYSNEDVSVMFRLDSSSEKNKKFNEFVKENNFNNPITKNTKFVVVSSQIPKPVYKKNIKFNLILNFGSVNAHYTVKSAIKNCQNTITLDYTQKLKQMI